MLKKLLSTTVYGCFFFLCGVLHVHTSFSQDAGYSSNNDKTSAKKYLITTYVPVAAKEIRGSVTDSTGASLSGVSVSVKNSTNIGTTTDLNGKYILTVPSETSILVFSMVSFDAQEIPVQGRDVINVVLKHAANNMNDVVVVGFSKQRKKDVVGSVTTINPGELKVPSSNLTTALAGRLAGVIAFQRSGEPGADNAEFFIRGATTFGYKKEPLILIDGIEYSQQELSRLQVDDIATFSILKDATASAVYGARGANGVILITTKEGKQGRAKIAIRIENSFSSPTKDVELADPITYMEMHNESYLTRGNLALPYLQYKIDKTKEGANPYMFPATNWKKMLFKPYTSNQRGNFSVSGGGQIANYFIAGSFAQDNGILNVDKRNNFNNNIDLKTYNLRSNIGLKVTKSTDVMVRLYGSFDDYSGPIDGGAGLYFKALRTNPVLFPPYYPVDSAHKGVNHILFGNAGVAGGNYLNPYADMVKGYRESKRSLMVAQFELKQDLSFITEGLSIRAMTNTNRQSYFEVARAYVPFWYSAGGYDELKNTYQLTALNADQGRDFVDVVSGFGGNKTVSSLFYLEAAANYNRSFEKHGVSAMVVSIIRSRSVSSEGFTLIQESLPFRNLGVSGRATYNYDSRYFLEFNFGYNGSERFHESKRFGFFPSVGVAWMVSSEKFMDKLYPTISKLKLRGNYGTTGNDEIGSAADRFFYLSQVNIGIGPGASFGRDGTYSRSGVTVSRYENPEITWETATNSTFGMELGLFNNKMDIIVEYFTEKRRNILMDRTLPVTLGLQATPKANVGQAKSKSFEFSIDYNENLSKNISLQTRANFTYSRNKFLKYEEPIYDEWYKSRVGWPVNQRWGYIAERLFVDDQEVDNSPVQTFGGRKTMGGDIKFRDVNGDGEITTLDQVPIGYPTNPEIIYGFGLSLVYKRFDISGFFQGSARSSFWIDAVRTSPFIDNDGVGTISENQLLKAYADDHWSEENRNLYALWPRFDNQVNPNNSQISTWFMRSGDFLRLKQVELGYNLSPQLLKRIKLEKLRLYGNATNLVTWSKFNLWDVEMGGNGLGYPIQKVINIGIQIGF